MEMYIIRKVPEALTLYHKAEVVGIHLIVLYFERGYYV